MSRVVGKKAATTSPATGKASSGPSAVAPKVAKEQAPSYSDDDYSDTSSESEGSDASATKVRPNAEKKKTVKRQTVDAAAYNRQQALEEWKRATGAAPAPAPQPKPKPAVQPKKSAEKENVTTSADSAKPKPPMVGRIREAAEDMARWFAPSETSRLANEVGLPPDPEFPAHVVKRDPYYGKDSLTAKSGKGDSPSAVSKSMGKVADGEVGKRRDGGDDGSNTFLTNAATAESAKPTRVFPEHADDENPSAVPDEGKLVSRKEFLDFLDLLADDDNSNRSPYRGNRHATGDAAHEKAKAEIASGMTRQGSSYVDANATWEEEIYQERRAEQRARREDAKVKAEEKIERAARAGGRPSTKIETEDVPMDPTLPLKAYHASASNLQNEAQRLLEFHNTVSAFEDVLTSATLTHKVTSFLELHHKEFVQSQPQRANGEFTHREYSLFNMYSEGIQSFIVKEMKQRVGQHFDVDNFVSDLFDQEQLRKDMDEENGIVSGSSDDDDEDSPNGKSKSLLSLESWDILLSILKFENFNTLMDEFIEAYYGLDAVREKTVGKAGLPTSSSNLSRTSPPPPAATSSAPAPSPSSLAASKTRATPTTATRAPVSPTPPSASGSTRTGKTGATPPRQATGATPTTTAVPASRSFREMRNLPSTRR